MTAGSYVRSLCLAALIVIALGGLLLHLRIHPYGNNPSFLINVVCGIISVIVVPLLFLFKGTLHYGYVVNGFMVIVGTVTMAHFSLAHLPAPLTPAAAASAAVCTSKPKPTDVVCESINWMETRPATASTAWDAAANSELSWDERKMPITSR